MLSQVEKYKITGEIGHGGMATVYTAQDTRLDRPVALKVMHPHLQKAPEARARFAREALSVARLKHPGILEIYDYSGEDSELSYIATELLTGPTLKKFVEEHLDIPAEIAACFAIAVARALKAAHAEGVIHRDVKPENVLIHRNREVKLTDFGIAQMVDVQSMTTTGQVLGSPGHMAPEQVEGKGCDARSDLFSLGTVLYFLATGKQPFVGRNPHQLLKLIVEGAFIDPLQVKPSIGGRLRAIILRCLKLDPAERYQSAAELEQDLFDFVKQIGIEAPTETLARYLSDPEGVSSEIRGRTLAYLIAAGEQAKSNVSVALDHFNRALALDEGNPRVLAALKKIGRRSRMRKMAWASVATLAVFALSALALVLPGGGWPGGPIAPEKRPSDSASLPGLRPHLPLPPRSSSNTAAERETPSASRETANGVHVKTAKSASLATRRVKFSPYPANVSIGVDGSEPRPFGPSFNEVELSPGIHQFKLVGAHDCCVDEEFSAKIPAGPGVTTIERRLKFRPAVLYVVSNTLANVSVDDGKVVGRARSVIQVPHEADLVETHRITVTAPGFKGYTGEVKLRAGRIETVTIALEPIEGK